MKNKKNNKEQINIGIDIGGSHITLALINNSGKILYKTFMENNNKKNPDIVLNEISDKCISLIDKSREYNKIDVSYIGVGCPGIINKGVIEFSPNLPKWKNINFIKIMKQKLKSRNYKKMVYISNDADAAAYGELIFGWGKIKNKKNLIHLTLGSGIGGGIIFNKKIYTGTSFNAAEIGHMTIKFDGRKCKCGNKGCFEVYCGTLGFNKIARELAKQNKNSLIYKYGGKNLYKMSPQLVYSTASKKDKTSKTIFENYGKLLGIGIANLINIFNIELITIGGGISKAHKFFYKSMISETEKRAFKLPYKNCEILISKLNDLGGIKGASVLYNNFK